MSLINKMLQDLDARGSQTGPMLQGDIKPVLVADAGLPRRKIALAAALVVCGIAVGLTLWMRRPAPAALPVAVLMPAPAGTPAPAAILVPAAVPVPPVINMPAVSQAVPVAPVTAPVPLAPPGTRIVYMDAPQPALARAAKPVALPKALTTRVDPVPAQADDTFVADARPVPEPARRTRQQPARSVETMVAVPAAPVPSGSGRQMTPAQQADSQYRQALAALDDGRVPTAMDHLEQALRLNPRQESARQSLVGLLIETGRKDEAVQQLEQGLAAYAGQPALAMLLARIQIERGASGVATLQRSLPSAENSGDYRAFLAGALQRDGRHREAADQYTAALRTAPDNAVWLMGLGISLQADKRNADALLAFQRASSTGTLTPALQSFVDKKVENLGGR